MEVLRFPYSLASNSAEELGLTASIMALWTCARRTMSQTKTTRATGKHKIIGDRYAMPESICRKRIGKPIRRPLFHGKKL